MKDANLCLEAGKEIDEEGVSHRVCHFEDPLLGQQGLHFISCNDVAFFQSLDSKVLASVLVPGQNKLVKWGTSWLLGLPGQNNFAEVASSQHCDEVEAVETHACVRADRQGRSMRLARRVPRSNRLEGGEAHSAVGGS